MAALRLVLSGLPLAGCGSTNSADPVTWWHNLEGGPIADQRPPPPNVDAPYGNLGQVPTKVPPSDAASRNRIANALVADRANALYAASLEPLPASPPKPATPKAPDVAPADDSNASLGAANASPAANPPPSAAPPPATVTPPTVTPPTGTPSADQPAAALPPVPEQPPAPASLAGLPAVTAPTPPPPTPRPVTAPAPLVAGAPVSVAFPPGSAALPSTALPGLKLLVRTRGAGVIGITGFGEAKAASPDAQGAAMPLAMARVRAVAAYLLEAGVPSSALRIDGEAQGTGAVARVIK